MEENNKIQGDQSQEDKFSDIRSGFQFFGIPDEEIPEYTTAQEFSKRFKRCSVLQMDEVRYAPASGASV